MWIDRGDIVTLHRREVTGRVIRLQQGCPRALVRYLDPAGGYRFLSEQVHYDDMRLATKSEEKDFMEQTNQRMRP